MWGGKKTVALEAIASAGEIVIIRESQEYTEYGVPR